MSRQSIDWSQLGAEGDEAEVIDKQESTPWADTIKTLIPVLLNTYQQQQLTKLNTERVKRGERPLTAQEYASQYMIPATTVQVGLDPATKELLMWGAIGIGALWFAKRQKLI